MFFVQSFKELSQITKMAALEASFSASSSSSSFSLSTSSSSYKILPIRSNRPHTLHLCRPTISIASTLLLSHNSPTTTVSPLKTSRKFCFEIFSVLQETTPVTEEAEESQDIGQKRKVYVKNLPWSLSVADISELFAQCGTVSDIELIKQKNGSSRGFAFVTMATEEEAQAAVEKLDSHESLGRIIRVEIANGSKKPPAPAPVIPEAETHHKLYVSNLAWKARSTHLREFFSTYCKPVSCRVVFETPTGKAAGYGFVSFATREEAEAAISALNGKELMGRPVILKFSERKTDESGSKAEKSNEDESNKAEVQPAE